MARQGKNRIPDRWLEYSTVGQRLVGTRFIAFKVPLKQSLCRQLSSTEVFTPQHLVDIVTRHGEDLGLIVDLTNTSRYYSVLDVPDSLEYVKIFTPGHQVPPDTTILNFKQVVRHFLRENRNNDKLIGVHCTHGLNRTGYLICRYLIDVDGVDPVKAIKLFDSSRGHVIERANYLQDLTLGPKRSNKGMNKCLMKPVRGGAWGRLVDGEQHLQRVPGGIPSFHPSRSQWLGDGFVDPAVQRGRRAGNQRARRGGRDAGFHDQRSCGSLRFRPYPTASDRPWSRTQQLDQGPSRYNTPPRLWNRPPQQRREAPTDRRPDLAPQRRRVRSNQRTTQPWKEGRPALPRYAPHLADQSR